MAGITCASTFAVWMRLRCYLSLWSLSCLKRATLTVYFCSSSRFSRQRFAFAVIVSSRSFLWAHFSPSHAGTIERSYFLLRSMILTPLRLFTVETESSLWRPDQRVVRNCWSWMWYCYWIEATGAEGHSSCLLMKTFSRCLEVLLVCPRSGCFQRFSPYSENYCHLLFSSQYEFDEWGWN